MRINLATRITFLRILMIPVFLVFLLCDFRGGRIAAAGVFALAALTDMLDGYIARSRNMITDLGKFLDPLADKLLVCAALVALIEVGGLPSWVVIIIVSREFIISGFRTLAASKSYILAAGFSGKLKTVSQMIMILMLILYFDNPVYRAACAAVTGVSLILAVYSAAEYIWKNRGLLKG